jgi:hypothetical protein
VAGRKSIPLTTDDIVAGAQHRAGSSAPQLAPAFRESLQALVDDLRTEARLNAFGTFLAGEELARCTANALLLREPTDPPATPADRAPIVVGGLPRTGTTLLQGLLLRDPENAGFTYADAYSPLVRHGDTRADAATRLALLNRMAPAFGAIHPLELDEPDECNALAQHTLLSVQFAILFRVPRYSSLLLDSGIARSFHYLPQLYRAVLDGARERRWVLKSPTHLLAYPSIAQCFPGAHVVQIHREPGEAISSWCSLIRATRGIGSRVDDTAMSELAEEWFRFFRTGIEQARSAIAADPVDRYLSVEYADVVERPMPVIEAIYERFGLELTSRARSEMTGWLTANHGRRSSHSYDRRLLEQTIQPTQLADLRDAYRALCAAD